MIEYFVLSALTTVMVAVAAYYIGRMDGYEEGLKKGSRAISNVNRNLDELILSLSEKEEIPNYSGWHADTASDPLPAAPPPEDVITTTPKVEVVEKPVNKKKAAKKKMTPKRKKGRK